MPASKPLIRSSLFQTLSFALALASTFLLTPFMIDKLGAQEFGLWVLITMVTSYFALSELGISSAVQNHLSVYIGRKDPVGYRRIFSNACLLYVLVAIVVLVLILLTIGVLALFKPFSTDAHLILVLLLLTGTNLAVSFLAYPFGSVLTSHLRLDITGALACLQIVGTSGLTFVVLADGYGLIAVALVTLAVGIATALGLVVAARSIAPSVRFHRDEINRDDIMSLFRYGGKTVVVQVADLLRFRVDEVVTGAFISVNAVTHYSVANRLATAPNSLVLKVQGILNPLFAQYVGMEEGARLRAVFLLTSKLWGAMAVFVFASLVTLGKPFIMLWVGPQFDDAVIPMILLAASYLVARMQGPLVSLFYATNTHHRFAYISLGEGIANLLLSIMFVVVFNMGLNGIALGTLLPMLVSKLAVQPFLASRLVGGRPTEQYALLARIALTGGLVYGTLYLAMMPLQVVTYAQLLIGISILMVACGVHILLVLAPRERGVLLRYVVGASRRTEIL